MVGCIAQEDNGVDRDIGELSRELVQRFGDLCGRMAGRLGQAGHAVERATWDGPRPEFFGALSMTDENHYIIFCTLNKPNWIAFGLFKVQNNAVASP